ncbi:MAG: hypothetical protein Q8R79_08980 [Legionellaceae bacterium]|nr:hypothetical protein [Legionellaceae bacterium]
MPLLIEPLKSELEIFKNLLPELNSILEVNNPLDPEPRERRVSDFGESKPTYFASEYPLQDIVDLAELIEDQGAYPLKEEQSIATHLIEILENATRDNLFGEQAQLLSQLQDPLHEDIRRRIQTCTTNLITAVVPLADDLLRDLEHNLQSRPGM